MHGLTNIEVNVPILSSKGWLRLSTSGFAQNQYRRTSHNSCDAHFPCDSQAHVGRNGPGSKPDGNHQKVKGTCQELNCYGGAGQ